MATLDLSSLNGVVPAEPDWAAQLTEIAHAAKAHWGYSEEWMRLWSAALTITPEDIAKDPFFGYVEDARLVGFCSVALAADEAWLDHLWVLPAVMGRGIGRALFRRAESEVAKTGRGNLEIESDPHARAFYEHMGASLVGYRRTRVANEERELPLLRKRVMPAARPQSSS